MEESETKRRWHRDEPRCIEFKKPVTLSGELIEIVIIEHDHIARFLGLRRTGSIQAARHEERAHYKKYRKGMESRHLRLLLVRIRCSCCGATPTSAYFLHFFTKHQIISNARKTKFKRGPKLRLRVPFSVEDAQEEPCWLSIHKPASGSGATSGIMRRNPKSRAPGRHQVRRMNQAIPPPLSVEGVPKDWRLVQPVGLTHHDTLKWDDSENVKAYPYSRSA